MLQFMLNQEEDIMLINCLDQFVNSQKNLCKGINKMLIEHESIPTEQQQEQQVHEVMTRFELVTESVYAQNDHNALSANEQKEKRNIQIEAAVATFNSLIAEEEVNI